METRTSETLGTSPRPLLNLPIEEWKLRAVALFPPDSTLLNLPIEEWKHDAQHRRHARDSLLNLPIEEWKHLVDARALPRADTLESSY